MSITIRYNGSSIHLQGIAASTPYTGDGEDNGSGVVAYYAESACGSLTRNGYRMATGKTYETATEALEGAREMASSHGLKVCKNCEKAAKWAISYEAPVTGPEFEEHKARVNAELEESGRRYKELKAAHKAKAETPAIDDHAAAVAKMRANREAEEEKRAAARRARNRTNYAPAPVLVINAETAPEVKEFHRKVKDAINLKW